MSRTQSPPTSGLSPGSYGRNQLNQIQPGEVLASRFKVRRILGSGAFGTVVEVVDQKDRTFKAVKIIRAEKRYIEEAKIEADILTKLKDLDHSPSARFVLMKETLEFEGTYCIVFERLGCSLYSLLTKNQHKGKVQLGLPIRSIEAIAEQILETLDFFHSIAGLVHTDIKPENILLTRDALVFDRLSQVYVPEIVDIKFIDFGGATFADQEHSALISTRPYRAPEVILALGWGPAADLWSVGCLLVELYTGQMLFPAENDFVLLEMFAKVRGRIPRGMIRASPRGVDLYDERLRFKWPSAKKQAEGLKILEAQPVLEELISDDDIAFRNLVYELLEYDPGHRITARAALCHPFFKDGQSRSRSHSDLN